MFIAGGVLSRGICHCNTVSGHWEKLEARLSGGAISSSNNTFMTTVPKYSLHQLKYVRSCTRDAIHPHLSNVRIGETTYNNFGNFLQPTIQHSRPLPAAIGLVCSDEKVSRVWTFSNFELFSHYTTTSGTFHVNNGVQNSESLPKKTVWKCPLFSPNLNKLLHLTPL